MVSHARESVIPLAKIGRFRGVKGEVVIHPYFDLNDEHIDGADVEIILPDQRICTSIERIWRHGSRTICKLACSESISDARSLVHGDIVIARSALTPLETGEYFADDLRDLDVQTVVGEWVGTVRRIVNPGGQMLLVAAGKDNEERLIPFVPEIVIRVDLEASEIVIDPPPGLLEINEN